MQKRGVIMRNKAINALAELAIMLGFVLLRFATLPGFLLRSLMNRAYDIWTDTRAKQRKHDASHSAKSIGRDLMRETAEWR